MSFDAAVGYDGHGDFTLTGRASSAAGVAGVEISATVGGVSRDLGAATPNADGSFAFTDPVGAATQGFITATLTDGAGAKTAADAGMSLAAGLAGAYPAEQDRYAAGGAYTGSTFFRASGAVGRTTAAAADGSALSAATVRPDGSSVVDVEAPGQTLHASFFDTFLNHGAPTTTFVFDPGHGLDVVRQFRAGGSDHDTVSLLASDFGNSIAEVLRDTTNQAGGAVIVDPTSGDAVKLAGVTKGQLAANRGDFAFHG